jgi:hypothetical protein
MRWSYVRYRVSADNSTSNQCFYVKIITFAGCSKLIWTQKNTITQSGGLGMRLNVSKRVPTEVATSFLTFGSTVFEVEVKVEDDYR